MRLVTAEDMRRVFDLGALIDFLAAAHRQEKAETADSLIGPPEARYLVRSAVSGLALGSKLVSIVPANLDRGLPSVQALFVVFDRADGRPLAVLDATDMTYWKTAADSALGARFLARGGVRILAIAGAGGLAPWLVRAHLLARPGLERVLVWNRTPRRAEALAAGLAAEGVDAVAVADLETAVRAADIVVTATMAPAPIVKGAWLNPGAHLDLVGSFTPDTREADDDCIRRARVFVDSRESALHGIGDIAHPIASGVMTERDILGDLYHLAGGAPGRVSDSDITLFKNAGGAHLDLMTAEFLLERLAAESGDA